MPTVKSIRRKIKRLHNLIDWTAADFTSKPTEREMHRLVDELGLLAQLALLETPQEEEVAPTGD